MFTNDAGNKRIDIFKDTMRLCKSNARLGESVKKSIANTRLYAPDDKPQISFVGNTRSTKISVTAERTFQAAKRLTEKYVGEKRIAVHNFASATNPGGGVTRGSSAQEEALCRCSTLYPCLNTDKLFEEYYSMHKKRHDVRYTDACIYTPDITVFKTDTAFPELMPESEWFSVDILTCAAPNLRSEPYNSMNPGKGAPVKMTDNELLSLHKKRGRHILGIAAENGDDILVLGAFGCGAFRNDPQIVARAYK
ncbi:MAG: TIGR02452 family protein, partial [Oscillospiraceae bacterium]|nr:TIGR02452 family protein [Oscillospiraceae bacterium]